MSALRLEAYDPWAATKARVEAARAAMEKERAEIKDPGVGAEAWTPRKAALRRDRRAAIRAAGGRPK